MRQMKSTNILLTINAVLMSAVLWTQLTMGGGVSNEPLLNLSQSAYAQTPMTGPEGVPNAGKQRQQTVDEIRALRATVESMKSLFQGAPIKVQVMNAEDLRSAAATTK